MPVGGAEKRITNLAKVTSSLLIFPSVGYGTPDIKRVNKGVEVGSVVGYGRQVNVLSRNDPLRSRARIT